VDMRNAYWRAAAGGRLRVAVGDVRGRPSRAGQGWRSGEAELGRARVAAGGRPGKGDNVWGWPGSALAAAHRGGRWWQLSDIGQAAAVGGIVRGSGPGVGGGGAGRGQWPGIGGGGQWQQLEAERLAADWKARVRRV
jgi:hypothetical protein